MTEGGRRRLIVPPDLAYGAQPPPGSGIAPNETLVFVVDLVEVVKARPPGHKKGAQRA